MPANEQEGFAAVAEDVQAADADQAHGEEAVQRPADPAQAEVTSEAAEDASPKDTEHDALLQAMEAVQSRLDALGSRFEQRILYTEHEEKVVDRMHGELQEYKQDLYAKLVRPILLDIIEIRDSLQRVSAAYRSKPEGEQAVPLNTFAGYADELQDLLERNEIEVYRSEAGEAFVPVRHKAVKKVITNEAQLHGTVVTSFGSGYSYGGKVISGEKIAVYCYEAPAAQTEEKDGTTDG